MRRIRKILAAAGFLAAASTLVPAPAGKPCLLGYYAHCPFTPVSTAICVLIGLAVLYVRRRGG